MLGTSLFKVETPAQGVMGPVKGESHHLYELNFPSVFGNASNTEILSRQRKVRNVYFCHVKSVVNRKEFFLSIFIVFHKISVIL